MNDRSVTFLKDRKSGQLVEAVLIDGLSRDKVESVESSWTPFLMRVLEVRRRAGTPGTAMPKHSHWVWRKKQRAVEGLIAYRMFGVECEGDMRGLMLVSTAGHPCEIKDQKGKEQVYVDFVAPSSPPKCPGPTLRSPSSPSRSPLERTKIEPLPNAKPKL